MSSSSDEHNIDGGSSDGLNRGAFLGATALALGGTLLGRVDPGAAASVLSRSQDARRGGAVQIAVGDASSSETLDPQRVWNQNHEFYAKHVYGRLFWADGGYNLHPELAVAWSSDKSGRKWTFRLRQGVTWHDGSPFTAKDVVWSIRRLFKKSLASPLAGVLSQVLDPKNVRVADRHTVVATLSSPDPFFPTTFAQLSGSIVKAGQEDFSLANAVGTGPFKFKSFTAGQSWTIIRNPNYWEKGLPYLDRISGVSIPDPTALVQAVTSGSSHLSSSIGFSQLRAVTAGNSGKVLTQRAFYEPYIVMDAGQKPFDDVRVRKAVKIADQRRSVLASAYQGRGVLTSDVPVPSTDPFYPSSLGIRPQQLATATSLLADAGYPNGLDLTLYTSDLLGGMVDMAVTFAQTLAPAGIRVKIEQHPAATYYDQVWQQKSFYTTWINRTHAVRRMGVTLTSTAAWNETRVPDTKVDGLLASVRATTDPAQQKRRMGTLLTWIADNDGYVNPAFLDLLLAAKRNLQGVRFQQGNGAMLTRAWLA